MKIKRLFGEWKGFYKLTCLNCNGSFYCREKETVCESCGYEYSSTKRFILKPKVLLGCEICEEWKENVDLYSGMFICSECAKDPDNYEYTITDGIE